MSTFNTNSVVSLIEEKQQVVVFFFLLKTSQTEEKLFAELLFEGSYARWG